MNGPEHYKEAERLIANCQDNNGAVYVGDGQDQVIAAAQVHATLALAAAVGTLDAYQGPISGYSLGRSDSDSEAWQAVTGTSDD